MIKDRKREIVQGLSLPTSASHSNSAADMATPDEVTKLGVIGTLDKTDHLADNHAALIKAGWDGKLCIGPIRTTEAIARLSSGEKLACQKEIPPERREQMRNAYRCVDCQEKMEEK